MSEPRFRRPRHQTVAAALAAFDADFMQRAQCYFAGGTRIVLEGRVEESGQTCAGIPVLCLDRVTCFAEKFLANADRGGDEPRPIALPGQGPSSA